MKKLVFGLIATVMITLNANAQRPNPALVPCEIGEHPVISFEFNTIKLHRASAGCKKRFSICSDGTWTVDCVPDSQSKLSNYNDERDDVLVVAEISKDGKTATLHFPIELKKSLQFTTEDFKNFGFDENYSLTKDFVIEKGEYIPTFTKEEILVKVNLK